MSEKSRPTHHVVIYDRNDYATRVGVAWPLKKVKGLSVVISPGVSIASIDGCRIVIVPATEKPKDGQRRESRGNSRQESSAHDDDDIPF
jgi:hypothetical protein